MRVPAVVFALLLSACTAMNEQASPSYSEGFGDGCATASAEGSMAKPPQRDQALYDKDPDYRAGWLSGHATCRAQGGPPRF